MAQEAIATNRSHLIRPINRQLYRAVFHILPSTGQCGGLCLHLFGDIAQFDPLGGLARADLGILIAVLRLPQCEDQGHAGLDPVAPREVDPRERLEH